MLRKFGLAFLAAVVAYPIGALAGGWLTSIFMKGDNPDLAGLMAGTFMFGPALACLAFIGMIVIKREERSDSSRHKLPRTPD
jgi:hypothetical protein